jgi:hypothetical protein
MPSLLIVLLFLNTMKRLFKPNGIVISRRNALESQNGINNCIIDDSYSSDQSKNSMDFLESQNNIRRKP